MKRFALLIGLGVVLFGCGGQGSSGSAGAGKLSEAQRVKAATAAMNAFVQMAGRTTADKAATLPGIWKAIPGFKDAGYDAATDTYWGTFSDGVPYMYFAGTSPNPPLRPSHSSHAMDQLPIPKKLTLMDSLGNVFGHDQGKIKAAADKYGYTAVMNRGRIEDLLVLNGVAGLIWQTHGGIGLMARGFPAERTEVYGLWTNTPMSDNPSPLIEGLIADGQLGVAGASEDLIANPVDTNHNGKIDAEEKVTHVGHYMILQKFVHEHMSIGENGFVWIDACSSASDPDLVGEFLSKGANVFVGWDKPTIVSNEATVRAFDRMLAENATTPKDDPPYRPENIFDVIGWLQRNGYDKTTATSGVATLKYFTAPSENFALLRPTIEHCNVIESVLNTGKATLDLTGEFGTARNYERSVTVDGTPITVLSWAPTHIVCELPNTGAGSYGLVVVRANGHKSNEVPITLWQVHMTYLFDGPGSLFYKWVMVVNFRQDVHKARRKPWELPKGALKRFSPMWDSRATVTSGGSGQMGGGNATWAGGGPAPFEFLSAPATYFFAIPTDFDTEAKLVTNFAFVGNCTITVTIMTPRGPVTEYLPGGPSTAPFTMELDADYSIKAKSVPFPTALGTGTLSWGTTGGVWTPDNMTQARPR